MQNKKHPYRTFLTVLFIVMSTLLLVCCGSAPAGPDSKHSGDDPSGDKEKLNIFFINVGKGDAALIGIPGGKWFLVDTGPKKGFAEVGRQLRLHKVDKLEAVFISHPHSDHVGNLDEILKLAPCKQLYTTPADYGKATQNMMETANQNGMTVENLEPGAKIEIGGATMTALGPNGTFPAENDNSLVLMLEYEGSKVLFAADQLFMGEEALLKRQIPLDCDVLKAGHHGESDASSPQWLAAAKPEYCIVTNTAEDAESPLPGFIERFKAHGATTYMLGETGTMLCEAEGGKVQFFAVKPPDGQQMPAFKITELDTKDEHITIRNDSGQTVDLDGWSILPEKGNDLYFFPGGTMLEPGKTLTVYSGKENPPPSGLLWTAKKIWHDKKADAAVLIDPYGREADRR